MTFGTTIACIVVTFLLYSAPNRVSSTFLNHLCTFLFGFAFVAIIYLNLVVVPAIHGEYGSEEEDLVEDQGYQGLSFRGEGFDPVRYRRLFC